MGKKVIRVALIGSALVALSSRLWAQESAPIVKIRQPVGIVGTTCDCTSCSLGVPCPSSGPNPLRSHPGVVGKASLIPTYEAAVSHPIVAETGTRGSADAHLQDPEVLSVGPALFTSPDGVISGGCSGNCGKSDCSGSCQSTSCFDWKFVDLCCPRGFWLRADYLMWWTSDDDVPPLVTSSPIGTPLSDVGVLGLDTTSTRFRGPLADGFRSGGRLRFGYGPERGGLGWAGSTWGLENLQENETWSSAGDPAYARPFFNADPLVNAEDAQVISFDGLLDGAVHVSSSSELYSGNIGLRRNVWCCSERRRGANRSLDLFGGYRYFRIREGLEVNESLESIALGGPVALGTRIEVFDRFRTTNEFHGGEFGVISTGRRGRWTSEIVGLVALGNVRRRARIDGTTTAFVPGQPSNVRSGGLLAQSTNIGEQTDNEFGVLPTFEANLRYGVTRKLEIAVGYSFMYLSEVVRPGDVVDPVVNGQLLDASLPFTGPSRPNYSRESSDLWVMGINLGVEYSF